MNEKFAPSPLPVPRPLPADRMPQRRAGDVHELRPGRLAAVILAPSHFACVLVQMDADPVVLADLGPAQPREERLGLIGVRGPRHAC